MSWLVASLVLSVALTIALNLAIRLFPGAADRSARALENLVTPRNDPDERGDGRVRVIFPWKAMLVASLLATIVLNLVFRLR